MNFLTHQDSKSQSSDSYEFQTEIILTLREEIRSLQEQNDILRKTIYPQNYVIEIKRYRDQIQILSDKIRSLNAENKGSASSETSQSHTISCISQYDNNDNEYKTGLNSEHLEPILDDQPQEIEDDVFIENFDSHDEYDYEALKTENKNLKRVIIALKSKYEHGTVAKNDTSLTLHQTYDNIKAKYETIIGLKPFPSESEWENSSHIIIEDVMNAYINKDHEFRLVERVNDDLRRKIAAYGGLLAENQQQREKMVHLTEKWNNYKRKVRVWKQQMHQQCVQPFQDLQAHAQTLSQQNKFQAQQILKLNRENSRLVWAQAKLIMSDQKQESVRIHADPCDYIKKQK